MLCLGLGKTGYPQAACSKGWDEERKGCGDGVMVEWWLGGESVLERGTGLMVCEGMDVLRYRGVIEVEGEW